MDRGGLALLYIEKNFSKEVNDEINCVKREQKSLIDRRQPQSAREAFENLNKSLIRKNLIKEQHGLCAYCMRRIDDSPATKIEHWQPIEKNPDGAIDYENMLAVCDGGQKVDKAYNKRHILCCDASKGSNEITINPLNSVQMQKIRYDENGKIYTFPKDKALEKDINDILHLNGKKGLDTSTQLVRNRREAYRSFKNFIEKNGKNGKLSRSFIDKKIKKLENQEIYDEFVGVTLYFLKRKLKKN